jgi:capsular polysaccharide transport system ATP-binding protein
MISFDNVSKFYPSKKGRKYVFKEVNIQIPMEKNIGILGPNGVGKSTLIRMMGGADYPNFGTIHSNKKISWPLGLQGGLQASMSGRENTRFVARIQGYKDTKEIEQKVAQFAGIGDYFNEPVKTYSSGMRSKVTFGLATAFDFNFDVLLIDELRAVGDANFKKKSTEILEQRYKNKTIIMVSHSMPELKKFCQSGIVIKNQNIYFHQDIKNAIQDYEETYDINQ